jgi:ribosomal protein S18 acetylase RimI-like enzyme
MHQLRPNLGDVTTWIERVRAMQSTGYRLLAAWLNGRAVAVAGYRCLDNLVHGRFLYVDDLVTADAERGKGFGADLLRELSAIGRRDHCRSLVLDTVRTNLAARRFYEREGFGDMAVRLIKPLDCGA